MQNGLVELQITIMFLLQKLNSRNKSVAAFSFIRLGVDNIPNTLNLIGPDGTVDYNRVTNFSASDYAGIFLMPKQ